MRYVFCNHDDTPTWGGRTVVALYRGGKAGLRGVWCASSHFYLLLEFPRWLFWCQCLTRIPGKQHSSDFLRILVSARTEHILIFFYKDWKGWGRQISKCKLNPRKQRLLCTDIWVSLRKSKQNLGFLGWAIPRPYASGRHEPVPCDTSPGAERPKPPRR